MRIVKAFFVVLLVILHGLLARLKHDGKYREYLLIASGCYFGLRISDLLNLKYYQILDKDEFVLREQKTGKERKIPINSFVKDALPFVVNSQIRSGTFDAENYLFVNRNDEKISVQFANQLLHKTFRDYSIRVQNGSSHTLRKTFGKRVWDKDGRSERAIVYLSEIFSHNNIGTTKRYIGITERQIADVYLQL